MFRLYIWADLPFFCHLRFYSVVVMLIYWEKKNIIYVKETEDWLSWSLVLCLVANVEVQV